MHEGKLTFHFCVIRIWKYITLFTRIVAMSCHGLNQINHTGSQAKSRGKRIKFTIYYYL